MWAITQPQLSDEILGIPARRAIAERPAVIKCQASMAHGAKGMRLFEDRVKYGREIAWRGIDDLQHFGSGGLLLQRFARLVDEARVLHRDDRLGGEVLQQCDLFVGKGQYLLP